MLAQEEQRRKEVEELRKQKKQRERERKRNRLVELARSGKEVKNIYIYCFSNTMLSFSSQLKLTLNSNHTVLS